MGIEKDLQDLKIIRRTINELHINLKSLKAEKDLLEGELNIASKDEAIKLQNKLNEVVTKIEEIKKDLRTNKRDAEVLEIITSSVAPEKKRVQSVSKHTPTKDEVSQIIGNKDEVSAIINSLLNRQAGNQTQSVAAQAHNLKPKRYTSRGIMKAKINALKNIAVNKSKSLMSHIKSSIKKINNAIRLSIAKRNETKRLKKLEKPKLRGPKVEKSRKYSGKPGTKNKINKLVVLGSAIIVALMACGPVALAKARNSEKINDNIYGETTRVTSEYLAEMENNLKLKEEKLLAIDLNKVDNNSEPTQNDSNINSKTDIDNNITKLNQSSSNNQKISNNNTKLNQNNSNNSKPRTKPDQSKNSKKLNQSNAKPSQNDTNNTKTADNKNEIKKVYGGEISASENGIMTEEDILYAVNKIAESENWFPEEVENIKEMIPALLEIQIENDVCPLAPIALAHWESHCGLDYEARKEIRYFNTTPWKGRIGDNGVSEGGYLTYYTTELAIKDFGKYLREGPPYTESPALTMQDLRAHGVYTWIFGGAGEEGQNTFNKLKGYLEKRVDKEDISKMVEGCTTSEIKDFSNTLIDEQKLANKEMSEIGE